MEDQSFFGKLNYKIRNSITLKLIAVGLLFLILLIPLSMITSLISEREQRRENVIEEVSSKWGKEQTIAGPILSVPYKVYFKDKEDKLVATVKYAHFLPFQLDVDGEILPEMRYRGIYEVVVYKSKLQFSGTFLPPDFKDWNIGENDILWKDAFVSLGIPDMRGIRDYIEIDWNGEKISFGPGIETNDVIQSGVSIRYPLSKDSNISKDHYAFSFDIRLNGSKQLDFVPLGRETKVKLKSNWSHPSFNGAFLPDRREVSGDGFLAEWKVLHLNRNYPQKWLGDAFKIAGSAFGVNLLLPVDEYQKTMRSAKYASMFISLTFLIFFFIEILNKKRIHPIQYILVGLALCIFFTLLLSISEHLTFNRAYLLSSVSVVSLITGYSRSIFKRKTLTMILGGVLIILYGFIFTILQLQDYALLMGSVGLFMVLAVVMYLSRKISWYALELGSNRMGKNY